MKMLALMCVEIVVVTIGAYVALYYASKLFWMAVLRARMAMSKRPKLVMPDGRKVDGVYRMRFEMAKEMRQR